ncbi:MAG: AIR carboxylase family protein, partial [Candidatus Zixiibacteriota bacterium]
PISSSALHGVDSLYSTVQMPPGVPVATVGVDASRNAGILAVQILAVADASLKERLVEFKMKMADAVVRKSAKLKQELGIQ